MLSLLHRALIELDHSMRAADRSSPAASPGFFFGDEREMSKRWAESHGGTVLRRYLEHLPGGLQAEVSHEDEFKHLRRLRLQPLGGGNVIPRDPKERTGLVASITATGDLTLRQILRRVNSSPAHPFPGFGLEHRKDLDGQRSPL